MITEDVGFISLDLLHKVSKKDTAELESALVKR